MTSLSALFLMTIHRSKSHHCKRGTLSSSPILHCCCPSSWKMAVTGEAQRRLWVLELTGPHPLISFLRRTAPSPLLTVSFSRPGAGSACPGQAS